MVTDASSGRAAAKQLKAAIELLQSVPVLGDIEPTTIQCLAQAMIPLSLERNETLFDVGDPACELYLIATGRIKLSAPSDSMPATGPGRYQRQSVLSVMGPGQLFGELSLFDSGRRSASATALTPTGLLMLRGAEFNRIISDCPDLARAMLRQLSGRLRRSHERTTGLVLSDVGGRLAQVLLYLGRRFGEPTSEGLLVRHGLTQTELAQMVGSSRETVNKTLTDFTDRGWVRMGHRRVTILSSEALRHRMTV